MNDLKHGALMILFVTACLPVWAINKCTNADGKVVFQDTPCLGQGEVMQIQTLPVKSGDGPAALNDAKLKAAEVDQRLAIQLAIERREAAIGMNNDQLQAALGQADQVNTGEYKSGSRQQHVYQRGNKTWYVYTDGLLVTAVQTSTTPGAASLPVQCPSGLEIRNAETSASSILLSETERAARQKEIQTMRACGK